MSVSELDGFNDVLMRISSIGNRTLLKVTITHSRMRLDPMRGINCM